jgi:hypothetical protein
LPLTSPYQSSYISGKAGTDTSLMMTEIRKVS